MYICPMYSSELIKGTLKTIVLKLLKEQGKMYGYEITQRVKELTNDKIQITEGALYPTLHLLEKNGEVETETEYIGKRVRKYYTITPKGNITVDLKVNEFVDFMNTMKFLLDVELNIANVQNNR
ncbi:MAG TPA: PadR family transcriptional regulator [Vicingus sp.]|jgi:PadR family transcriptional regulator PadR|nr:PadR family transcriptional regulator [Vicingus sp.]